MIRLRAMPSDFHPLILVLGAPEDFRMLSGWLRMFARAPRDMRLDQAPFCAPTSTHLQLTPANGRRGVWPVAGTTESFDWMLDGDAAEAFAETIDELVAPGVASGSELLECGDVGAWPVKISHGEFMDAFLTPGSTIPA